MNLMFRKNFREGASGGRNATGVGGKLASKGVRSQAKRSRDMSGFQNSSDTAECHYRTHIFFSAPSSRTAQQTFYEERCGPVTGAANSFPLTSSTMATTSCDVDAPQPLVDRRPSMSLLKWTSNLSKNDYSTTSSAIPLTTTSKQATHGTSVSVSTLDRDCFIIPAHSLDRFLPAGIPLPTKNADGIVTSPLSVLQVSDPKICILAHLMSPLEPIDPILESPLSHPLFKQRAIASELLNDVQQTNNALGGMLLANMERNSDFPFIAYYVINTAQTDPSQFYLGIRTASLTKFEPRTLRYTAAHTLDLYCEVAAICRPPLNLTANDIGNFKRSQTSTTCYIINVFKVFEGDDGERFEKHWLYWTGARMLYRYLPKSVGLRRITLHKSISQKGDKMYLLICECSDLLKDITAATYLIPSLRARLCGYIGLYKPIQDNFENNKELFPKNKHSSDFESLFEIKKSSTNTITVTKDTVDTETKDSPDTDAKNIIKKKKRKKYQKKINKKDLNDNDDETTVISDVNSHKKNIIKRKRKTRIRKKFTPSKDDGIEKKESKK